MKRFFALTLAACLILCGCGQQAPDETTTAATTETTTAPAETTQATTEATEPSTEPTMPEDVNPLTGEALDAPSNDRPYAIMINNHKAALPHCGISEADVLYELPVEGGMTRYMAIFLDPSQAKAIGSVRSARPPFVQLVQAYDAIYSSASGMDIVLNQISDSGVDYINALKYDGSYFYRDQARRNRGVSLEHTLFISGENLEALAQKNNLRTTRIEGQTYGFHFDEAAPFNGDTGETITISFQSDGKQTKCTYSEDKGGYTLYQQSRDYVDGNTGELVVFRNVLILEGECYPMNNGSHQYIENVGEGPGYYARDGKIIPITWSRESEDSPFVYKTADGTELNMGVGTTYCALIADGSPVEYK